MQTDQGFDNTNQGEAQVSEFTDNEKTGWNLTNLVSNTCLNTRFNHVWKSKVWW